MNKIDKYLNEGKMRDVYFRMSKKDLAEIKKTIKKLEVALKEEEEIDARSAARTIESSVKRIHDNMMEAGRV